MRSRMAAVLGDDDRRRGDPCEGNRILEGDRDRLSGVPGEGNRILGGDRDRLSDVPGEGNRILGGDRDRDRARDRRAGIAGSAPKPIGIAPPALALLRVIITFLFYATYFDTLSDLLNLTKHA